MNVSVGLHSDFLSKDYERQLKSQFDKFIDTFGFKPSHIDIHKPQADSYLFVSEFCKNHNIPFRNHGVFSKGVKTTSEPVFNGTVPDFGVIENYLKSLKSGFYEILFHPGIFDPSSKSSLNKEREVDAKHVIMLNSILGKYKIKLASFLDLSKC